MAIFNGSRDGYERGFRDGVEGRPKQPVSGLKALIGHVIRPPQYTESYLAGYSSGWVDGNRKRKGV